jgi:sterol desaturase/sphingolipid hydroxylase (fatty acid hydroxylase superfamily)
MIETTEPPVLTPAKVPGFNVSRGWRRAASVVLFPVLLGSCLAAGFHGIEAGVWPPLIVVLLAPVVVGVVVAAERWMPFRTDWRATARDLRTDAMHLVVSTMLLPPLIRWLLTAALLPGAAWLSGAAGFPVWPSSWPLLLQLVLALVLADLTGYWVHRLAHEVPLLWRFHMIHHQPDHLYSLNSGRVHPVEVIWGHACDMAPLILLGCGIEALTMWTIFHGVVIFCAHANIDVRTGVLAWIVNTPELHRWHHSRNLHEANRNYSGNLVLWDLVFRTRFLPKARPVEVGIAGRRQTPDDYLGQLAAPFRHGIDS